MGSVETVTTALATAAFLAIAVLAAVRGRREPLAARFAVLAATLFAYDAFEVSSRLSRAPAFAWLDAAAASLAPAAFLQFTIAFVGRRRELRRVTQAFAAYFAALGCACLFPAVDARFAAFPNGPAWSALMLAGMAPIVALGVVLLVRHARASGGEERARTVLAAAAVLVAAAGTASDLASIAGANAPRLSALALVASAALLATVALRVRLVERVTVLAALNAAAVALAVVLGELAIVRWASDRTALVALGSVVIVLVAFLAGRFLLADFTSHRERLRTHATLGRLSQQMAHDLRNPLAAIRGAAQFLQGELAAGRPLEAHAAFLELVVAEADRMTRVIADYQRLGRVDPALRPTDVNGLVRVAARAARATSAELGDDVPRCAVDPDLLTIAVENVLRNAREAAGEGGRVVVTTRAGGGAVTIEVGDDGPGMDPRTLERVFDEFFTTKASGSGLGLSFVRRVMEAHHGSVAIDSAEGRGTRVLLTLPLDE
ncbi:MAG TPA: ATP-binding protein [Minicystis sp.]|nr:ATP-binding protein [Minicystis sp.]